MSCDALPYGPEAHRCMRQSPKFASRTATPLHIARTILRERYGWHHVRRTGHDVCPKCWTEGHR
jgi:hypothetical protein